MSCDRVLTAIDRDDGPGDAASTVADQERSQGADVLNVDKLVLRRSGGFRSQHFIEMRDPTARPGADGAGRNCVGANAFWSELHSCVTDRAFERRLHRADQKESRVSCWMISGRKR